MNGIAARTINSAVAATEREPGRAAAVGLGLMLSAFACAGLWFERLSDWAGVVLVGCGVVLISLGALGGMIEELWVSRSGGGLKTRDPNQTAGELEASVASIQHSELDPADVDLPGDRLDGVRYLVGLTAIETLLTDLDGPLHGCEARIFLMNSQSGRLTPVLSPRLPGDGPAGPWRIGQGVTGHAYARGEYVLATGDSVFDGTYDVPPELRDGYRDLSAVAAAPLWSTQGEILGVLSLSSEDPQTELATDAGEQEHLFLAECVAYALDELMGLDPDVE